MPEIKTLLLVENEDRTARAQRMTLEKYGYKVIIARSGNEAITKVRTTEGIGLILMNINLGKNRMDGTEAAEIILNEKDIPLLFISSFTQPEALEKTKKIPSYGYVVKNCDEAILDKAIRMALQMHEARNIIREKERSLLRTKECLELAQDAAGVGMWDWDIISGSIEWTPRMFDLFGLDDTTNPSFEAWRCVVHPDDRKSAELRIKQALKNHSSLSSDYRIVRPDGTVRWIGTLGRVIYDDHGRPVRMAGTCADITDFKRLERQLHQAMKMEAVGTLAGGIAHDFNNIVTVLMGYVSLILTKIDKTSEFRLYLDQIFSACEKAAYLIKSLLAFSRQQPITLVPMDINNTIRTAKKFLKRLITEDIELHTSLTSSDMVVMADRSQIDMILFNLVTNARDAMPMGGTLVIGTKAFLMDDDFLAANGFGEPGSYVVMSVSDTGEGMDEMTKGRIFDPFFTTKEVGKGTGLGLAMVYGTVKQHHGYITVDSTPGQGTTFRIYIPAVNMRVRKKERSVATPLQKGTETILIAEDNEGVRNVIVETLRHYAYRTIEATDGQDAIDIFKKNRAIDLIIIDSVMPRKNGWEAYEEIRREKPDIKVLFISGYTKDVILRKGVADKEFNFIAKPISLDKLVHKVREILNGGR